MHYFLAEMRPNALCVFDVNLCPDCCAAEVIGEALGFADIVKLNNEEVPKVMDLVSLQHSCDESSAFRLLDNFGLKMLFLTRGSEGSMLVDAASRATEHRGYPAPVADTIGAGDAFTAMMMDRYLRGATPEEIR